MAQAIEVLNILDFIFNFAFTLRGSQRKRIYLIIGLGIHFVSV